jgi:hypothetical protein
MFPELVDLPHEEAAQLLFSKLEENYKKGNEPAQMALGLCEDRETPFVIPVNPEFFSADPMLAMKFMLQEILTKGEMHKRKVMRLMFVFPGMTGGNFGGIEYKDKTEAIAILSHDFSDEDNNILIGGVLKRDENGDVTEITGKFTRTKNSDFPVQISLK